MDLGDYAYALSVRIIKEEPPGGRWGDYCNSTRTIRLHPELGPLQRGYKLGHELGHAYHEHSGCYPRLEWEPDVFAATMLLRRSDWREATSVHDSVGAFATELGVLPKVVRIYYENLLQKQRRRLAA